MEQTQIPAATIAAITAMRSEEAASYRLIAERTGVPKTTVARVLAAQGVPNPVRVSTTRGTRSAWGDNGAAAREARLDRNAAELVARLGLDGALASVARAATDSGTPTAEVATTVRQVAKAIAAGQPVTPTSALPAEVIAKERELTGRR